MHSLTFQFTSCDSQQGSATEYTPSSKTAIIIQKSSSSSSSPFRDEITRGIQDPHQWGRTHKIQIQSPPPPTLNKASSNEGIPSWVKIWTAFLQKFGPIFLLQKTTQNCWRIKPIEILGQISVPKNYEKSNMHPAFVNYSRIRHIDFYILSFQKVLHD